jgi:hypothetical protein
VRRFTVVLHPASATVDAVIHSTGQIYAMGGMVTQLNLQASQPGAITG